MQPRRHELYVEPAVEVAHKVDPERHPDAAKDVRDKIIDETQRTDESGLRKADEPPPKGGPTGM